MTENQQTDRFSETHHALLHGWIARAVIEHSDEKSGEAVIRKAVRRYGEERGGRQRLRAQANRHPLSMLNFVGYGEYKLTHGALTMKVVGRIPHARTLIPKCPWFAAWKDDELLPFGRLYCAEIDQALVRGYNPELQLEVIGTMSGGSAECQFVYHDVNLTLPNYLLVLYRKAVYPGSKAVMTWDYHVCHLYSTYEKVIIAEMGQVGQQAVEAGLAQFVGRFGERAKQKVLAGRSVDYERLSLG